MTGPNPYAAPELVSSEPPVTQLRHPAFLGFLATQFLGAFNDNLFKQLLLLLAIPVAGAAVEAGGQGGTDLQGFATILFGMPFVLFGGLAGYVSDRWSKRTIIVLSKIAEVVVMGLGLLAFLATPSIGFAGLWIVLFLMGLQSTFFGPGKYGMLPEMLPEGQLSRANGLILMTTFIAIIIGTAVAGPLKDAVVRPEVPQIEAARELWVGSLACVLIAIAGVASSWLIVKLPPAAPGLRLKRENLGIPAEMRRLLAGDRQLLVALLASCVFWLIAGLTIQSVNSLGKTQLALSDTLTSFMVAMISIGIAAGGLFVGVLTRKLTGSVVIALGMWGTVAFCLLLSITLPGRGHLLGYGGSVAVLTLLGTSAAWFAIPIQVFLQSRPPDELKGRMIAVMNQANFFAIVVSGILYQAMDWLISTADLPRSALFAVMAVLFLPVAILYKLPNETNVVGTGRDDLEPAQKKTPPQRNDADGAIANPSDQEAAAATGLTD